MSAYPRTGAAEVASTVAGSYSIVTPNERDLDSLDRIRQQIERVDRSIVMMLAARIATAQRALRLRAGHDRNLTDRKQERRVLARSRMWAQDLGVPPALVEDLFRSLIEEGKARFQSATVVPEPPVVTVLLVDPVLASHDLERPPEVQLVAVPESR
ncbi:chorismate mutase [mine drainage metagenome]|uniref:Chorismate mutase n=1 Tax=mine drainage metagenome TaxID=410659 RepID=T1BZY4_9ZZZZ